MSGNCEFDKMLFGALYLFALFSVNMVIIHGLIALPFLKLSMFQAGELLYASQKIAAGDAAKRGLVTRVVWEEKFEQDVVDIITDISNQSRQVFV